MGCRKQEWNTLRDEGNSQVNDQRWVRNNNCILSLEGHQYNSRDWQVFTALIKMPGAIVLSFNLKTECLDIPGQSFCLCLLALTMCWWSCCSTLIALGQPKKLISLFEMFYFDLHLKTGGRYGDLGEYELAHCPGYTPGGHPLLSS